MQQNQLKEFEAELAEAEKQLKYWKNRADALASVVRGLTVLSSLPFDSNDDSKSELPEEERHVPLVQVRPQASQIGRKVILRDEVYATLKQHLRESMSLQQIWDEISARGVPQLTAVPTEAVRQSIYGLINRGEQIVKTGVGVFALTAVRKDG